jgi:hypothetical protein
MDTGYELADTIDPLSDKLQPQYGTTLKGVG